jgi:acetylornithine/N-succinyldiaminopimelate aminotransferase
MDAVLAPGFLQEVEARSASLITGLSALSLKYDLGEVRGRGLLVAMELEKDIASRVVEIVLDNGLLLNAPRANLLRFMPALNLSVEEIDTMLEILEDGLRRAIDS